MSAAGRQQSGDGDFGRRLPGLADSKPGIELVQQLAPKAESNRPGRAVSAGDNDHVATPADCRSWD